MSHASRLSRCKPGVEAGQVKTSCLGVVSSSGSPHRLTAMSSPYRVAPGRAVGRHPQRLHAHPMPYRCLAGEADVDDAPGLSQRKGAAVNDLIRARLVSRCQRRGRGPKQRRCRRSGDKSRRHLYIRCCRSEPVAGCPAPCITPAKGFVGTRLAALEPEIAKRRGFAKLLTNSGRKRDASDDNRQIIDTFCHGRPKS